MKSGLANPTQDLGKAMNDRSGINEVKRGAVVSPSEQDQSDDLAAIRKVLQEPNTMNLDHDYHPIISKLVFQAKRQGRRSAIK